jgi:mRNA interferase MazF
MKRGEVWWSEHPAYGGRPALILTRTEAIASLHEILMVPATRTIRGISTEVELGPEDGMPSGCVLTLDNTTTLAKGLFIERIARLGPERMSKVCQALAAVVDC